MILRLQSYETRLATNAEALPCLRILKQGAVSKLLSEAEGILISEALCSAAHSRPDPKVVYASDEGGVVFVVTAGRG